MMSDQISLSNEEYRIPAVEAARSGLDPKRLLRKRSPFAQELMERQYLEGKISHIPTKEPLTEEEREALEQSAQWFAEGKPLSEMIIEDRGPY